MKQLTMEEKIATLEKALEKLNKKADLQVKIKKLHPDAVIPTYAHETDCGMDLTVVSIGVEERDVKVYGFGISVEIPEGYAGFIFPRSSISKKGLILTNCVGVIDSGYRGEIKAKFAGRVFKSYGGVVRPDLYPDNIYAVGDRAAQMVILPYPKVEFVEVDELSDTERGTGGYGSTGK